MSRAPASDVGRRPPALSSAVDPTPLAPTPSRLYCVPILAGLFDPLLGVFVGLAGIFRRPAIPERLDSQRRRRRGLALVLGGIEGPSRYNRAMVMGLARSGFRGAIRRVPWNAGIPGLRSFVNLMSRRHHERESDRLIDIIVGHIRAFPGAPVCLLAQSGGCWIVVRALEKLPPDATVQSAVLLAPSISPGYDLARAARRCRAGLTAVGGPGDFMFLGVGTTVFGTSDRRHGPSAGWVGWRHQPPGFIEARWRRDWTRFGYLGNHTSSGAERFIAQVVAPWLAPPALGTGRFSV